MSEITYRWIDGPTASNADWDRIETLLATRGWMSLNRATSRILVAEDDAKRIIGFYVLQLLPHLEPMWIAPSARNSHVVLDLIEIMQEFVTDMKIRGFMVVAENPAVAAMCESKGMKKVDVPVYVRI